MKSVETKSLELGTTSERSTESVLRAVCLRLGCTAATAVFPREDSRAVWSRSEEDAAFARQQLPSSVTNSRAAPSTRASPSPPTNSSTRAAAQIACKLIAVPLIARGGPAGALIIFNRPDEPSFDEFTVRRLGRFARLLARNATQDLDSLTGLLSWDGFKTRVDTWQRNAPAGRHGVDVVRRHRLPAPHQRPRRLLRRRSRDRALWRRDPPRARGRRQFRVPPFGRPFHRVPAAHESGAGAPARRTHLPRGERRLRAEARA